METFTQAADQFDDAAGGRHWRWAILTSLADYIDAGSIVAGGAGLALWSGHYGWSALLVGIIAAISSNAWSAGVGALIGGRLGDLLGRKRIYSWDLLLYCFGTLWIIFNVYTWMIIVGYVLIGLAVGADVPTSWSLISEFAPKSKRAKLMGLTNIFWYIGPIVTLLISLGVSSLGLLGPRILFAHLFVVAIVTWFLRRTLVESPRWSAAAAEQRQTGRRHDGRAPQRAAQGVLRSRGRDLFRPPNLQAFIFIAVIYTLWNIPAGTFGFFLPTILHNVGARSQFTSVAIDLLWFVTAILTVGGVFMPLADRMNRRILYAVSALFQTVTFVLMWRASLHSLAILIAAVAIYGLGQGIGQWPMLRIWSVELFPTEIRNTAQGASFAAIRLSLGVWSFFFPTLVKVVGFHNVALYLMIMMLITLVVGTVLGPRTEGRSLEEIQEQTGWLSVAGRGRTRSVAAAGRPQ